MARKMRIFVPGGVYHVYCRASRGEMVFNNKEETEYLISELQRVKKVDGLTIFAWCVMGNHYHVGLRTGDVPLWRTMASLQGRFARQYNKRHRVMGPLWQSRYKARVVDSQEYFEQLLSYIHLNPVVARIVDDPLDYENSGHREILGLKSPLLVDVNEALLSFGRTKKAARRVYRERLACCLNERWIHSSVRALPWWRSVDDDEELVAPGENQEYQDYLGSRVEIQRCWIALHEIEQRVCLNLGVEMGDIGGGGKNSQVAQARILFTYLAVERYGHRVRAVAEHLNKHSGSVSRWLSTAREARSCNADMRSRIDALHQSLSAARTAQHCEVVTRGT